MKCGTYINVFDRFEAAAAAVIGGGGSKMCSQIFALDVANSTLLR